MQKLFSKTENIFAFCLVRLSACQILLFIRNKRQGTTPNRLRIWMTFVQSFNHGKNYGKRKIRNITNNNRMARLFDSRISRYAWDQKEQSTIYEDYKQQDMLYLLTELKAAMASPEKAAALRRRLRKGVEWDKENKTWKFKEEK